MTLRVMFFETIRNDDFLAQCKPSNMAATLFRKVTTLFQQSNVLLRKKLSL